MMTEERFAGNNHPLVKKSGCLWDTEWYDPRCGGDGVSLTFFQNPIGTNSRFPLPMGFPKSITETNVNQSAMIDYPREFLVCGLNVFIESGIHDLDRAQILNKGCFSFVCSGNRPIFQRPLNAFPIPKEFESLNLRPRDSEGLPMVPLVIGESKQGYRLKSGAAFNAKISFNDKPMTSKPISITVVLEGYDYSPDPSLVDPNIEAVD